MAEAARILKVSRRKLQDIIKDYPRYYEIGRRKYFENCDIESLRLALRSETEQRQKKELKCLSSSSPPVPEKARTTASVALTSGRMWIEAQKRLSELRQQDS